MFNSLDSYEYYFQCCLFMVWIALCCVCLILIEPENILLDGYRKTVYSLTEIGYRLLSYMISERSQKTKDNPDINQTSHLKQTRLKKNDPF